MTATTGERTAYPSGPLCRRCRTNEARCAYEQGCCPACSHTFAEPAPTPISARRAYFQQRYELRKAEQRRTA